MAAVDTYHNNSSGLDKITYDSAANIADDKKLTDLGNELRKLILTWQQANINGNNSAATNTTANVKGAVTDTTANVKNTKYKAMIEQMIAVEMMMETMMALMAVKLTNTTQGNKKLHPFKHE